MTRKRIVVTPAYDPETNSWFLVGYEGVATEAKSLAALSKQLGSGYMLQGYCPNGWQGSILMGAPHIRTSLARGRPVNKPEEPEVAEEPPDELLDPETSAPVITEPKPPSELLDPPLLANPDWPSGKKSRERVALSEREVVDVPEDARALPSERRMGRLYNIEVTIPPEGDRNQAALDLWAAGYSGGIIAQKIGRGVTRNMVVGVIHRARAKGDPRAKKRGG